MNSTEAALPHGQLKALWASYIRGPVNKYRSKIFRLITWLIIAYLVWGCLENSDQEELMQDLVYALTYVSQDVVAGPMLLPPVPVNTSVPSAWLHCRKLLRVSSGCGGHSEATVCLDPWLRSTERNCSLADTNDGRLVDKMASMLSCSVVDIRRFLNIRNSSGTTSAPKQPLKTISAPSGPLLWLGSSEMHMSELLSNAALMEETRQLYLSPPQRVDAADAAVPLKHSWTTTLLEVLRSLGYAWVRPSLPPTTSRTAQGGGLLLLNTRHRPIVAQLRSKWRNGDKRQGEAGYVKINAN